MPTLADAHVEFRCRPRVSLRLRYPSNRLLRAIFLAYRPKSDYQGGGSRQARPASPLFNYSTGPTAFFVTFKVQSNFLSGCVSNAMQHIVDVRLNNREGLQDVLFA
jgi:hypothetical protein